jgi:hypothetical protein
MSDSTLYLDAGGIRRQVPLPAARHEVPVGGLPFLALIANLGDPGSVERRGWDNLLRVHGFPAVVRATARCYHQADESGKVTNDQAQAVLDGKLPCGHEVIRHALAKRRAKVA